MLDVAKEEQEAAEVEAEEEAFNPDMAATSVTLGATILLCRENDTQVQVPLFRRGRDTELTEVEVTTEDGSAKLGEVRSAKLSLQLNLAAASLKLDEPKEVLTRCSGALEIDPNRLLRDGSDVAARGPSHSRRN